MEGKIFDIYRLTTHDGPGMRDTVFLKGCSLSCVWCQNPESIDFEDKVWYRKNCCIGCGMCLGVCPSGAVSSGEKGIKFDYKACLGCYACTEVCVSGALSAIAERVSTEDVLRRVMRDKAYFEVSGGGVTLSGGEPLLQPEFTQELLTKLKKQGISTALDTCAMVSENVFTTTLPLTDILLLDIKVYDGEAHRQLTGADNRQILSNAIAAAAYVKENPSHRFWVRTPIIPGATDSDENLGAIARFIRTELAGTVERWELCMFNRAATVKYESLGMEWRYQSMPSISAGTRDRLLGLAAENAGCEVIASGIIQEEK